jgi:hypothetical protein
VPTRQRSMQATFDHSWRLLTERERGLLRQMSVFRGGFTREAVQAVTGAEPHDLRGLVDASWLQLGLDGRYGMHELVRQYAGRQLAGGEQFDGTQRLNTITKTSVCGLLRRGRGVSRGNHGRWTAQHSRRRRLKGWHKDIRCLRAVRLGAITSVPWVLASVATTSLVSWMPMQRAPPGIPLVPDRMASPKQHGHRDTIRDLVRGAGMTSRRACLKGLCDERSAGVGSTPALDVQAMSQLVADQHRAGPIICFGTLICPDR